MSEDGIIAQITGGNNINLKYQIWRGYIQEPKWDLDVTTRLGGSKLITQKLRKISNISQIQASFLSDEIEQIDNHIASSLNAVGEFLTVSYFGRTIPRVLFENLSYNVRAVDGSHKLIVNYNLILRAEESNE